MLMLVRITTINILYGYYPFTRDPSVLPRRNDPTRTGHQRGLLIGQGLKGEYDLYINILFL